MLKIAFRPASLLPEQLVPSSSPIFIPICSPLPVKPLTHEHLYDPFVFSQCPPSLGLVQTWKGPEHSLMSAHKREKEEAEKVTMLVTWKVLVYGCIRSPLLSIKEMKTCGGGGGGNFLHHFGKKKLLWDCQIFWKRGQCCRRSLHLKVRKNLLRNAWVQFPAGLRFVCSSDPAVSSSIVVGVEREELIRNDPDKSECTIFSVMLAKMEVNGSFGRQVAVKRTFQSPNWKMSRIWTTDLFFKVVIVWLIGTSRP